MFSNADEVLKFIKDEDVKFVDVRFCDLPGVMQHFNVPAEGSPEEFFTEGQMFDGSSIRGFQTIHESDMKLIPDLARPTSTRSGRRRPSSSTLDPSTRSRTRPTAATRATSHEGRDVPASTGIADTAFFAPEAEFYIFDDVRFETKQNAGYYSIDSVEGAWNSGRSRRGRQPRLQDPVQGRLLPRPPGRPLRRPPRRDDPQAARGSGSSWSARTTRSAPPARRRSTTASTRCCKAGRRHHEVQVHRQERRLGGRQDRDLHAEADLRRQRLGHARAPVAVEGRQAAVLRRGRLRRPVRHRALVHRRPARARARRCWPSPTRR